MSYEPRDSVSTLIGGVIFIVVCLVVLAFFG